jgi:hypothetical protein
MRNWTDEEIEKSAKRTVKKFEILAKKQGITVEELFLRLIDIAGSNKRN